MYRWEVKVQVKVYCTAQVASKLHCELNTCYNMSDVVTTQLRENQLYISVDKHKEIKSEKKS